MTGALGVGYLLGNYRSMASCENDLKRDQVGLNCLYMTVLAEKGPQALRDRIVEQLNVAVAGLDRASEPSLRKLVNASVFGKPSPDQPFRICAAWDLQVFKDHFPDAPFTESTRQFIEQYSQYIREDGVARRSL